MADQKPVPSILHTPEVARTLTSVDIHHNATLGLTELRNEDRRINQFCRGKDRVDAADLRFRDAPNDLFASKSFINRRSLTKPETDWIRDSVDLYLTLVTNYLHIPGALDTLEYLIRIYSIHEHNWEALLLCAMHYYEQPLFVRIRDLLPIRNTKWDFLLHAAPSTDMITQSCIHDMQILDCLCAYVPKTETKNFPPSRVVFSFTLAIVLRVVRGVPNVDDHLLNRIRPFLDFCLNSGSVKRLDVKAGALIVAGLLQQTSNLGTDYFLKSIVNIVQQHAKDQTSDWPRLSIIALINLVQLHSVTKIPRNLLDNLVNREDISELLLNLSTVFNIRNFLRVLLDSLIHSSSQAKFCKVLLGIISTVPMDHDLVHHLISTVLVESMDRRGPWCSQIMSAISQNYFSQLQATVLKFVKYDRAYKYKSYKYESKLEMVGIVFDFLECKRFNLADFAHLDGLSAAVEISLQALFNPGDTYQESLSAVSAFLGRYPGADDLGMVHTALSATIRWNAVSAARLLNALTSVLREYSGETYRKIFQSRVSHDVQQLVDVLALSLKYAVSFYCREPESSVRVRSAYLSIQDKVFHYFQDLDASYFNSVISRKLCGGFEDLFYFLVRSDSRGDFGRQLRFRMEDTTICPVHTSTCPVLFQSQLIRRQDVHPQVRIKSLNFFSELCSHVEWSSKILERFPTVLVLLKSRNEQLRGAAFSCIQKLVESRRDEAHVNDLFLRELVGQGPHVLEGQFLPNYFSSTFDTVEELKQRFEEFAVRQNILSLLCVFPAFGFRLEQVPGDVVLDLSKMTNQSIKLGSGLRQDNDVISATRAGKLSWVQSSHKRIRDVTIHWSCLDANGKVALFGPLRDGFMFETSTGLSRMLLSSPTCPVLEALGKKLPFETAVGVNGRVCVNAAAPRTVIIVSNAIQNSESLSGTQQRIMVEKLLAKISD